MLDPYDDRRLLLEALRPPDGFKLDHAIGTTFSLDLMALLAAPLAFSSFSDTDTPASDPLILLEALRASAERITLFCDAGRIYVPPADRLLFAHLEDSVVECIAPRGGAFHPKVWLLRFTEEDTVAFRFLCLSRNLTFDRSWDTSLVLDGGVRGRTQAVNRPLAEFVRALPDMAVGALAGARTEAVERLASEVLRVRWELPEAFDSMAFHPIGHHASHSPWPFNEARIDRLFVASPFVSAPMLERLAERGSGHVLVSRPDQLDMCDSDALARYPEVRILEDATPEDASDELTDSTMRGLHAKLYIADQGWDATVWTGSANATTSAFERNVEFLVELHGKRSKVGIEALLRTANRDEVTFSTLLAPYVRSEDAPGEPPPERTLERQAGDLRRGLASAGLELRVLDLAEGDLYDMVLSAPTEVISVSSLVSLESWPVTRKREISVERVDLAGCGELAQFTQLPLEKLTPFLAFRAVLRSGDVEITTDFVLNVPLLDAPAARRAHLLRWMLSNRAEVLRYLLYLLSGDTVEAIRALAENGLSHGVGENNTGGALALPLLEALLRTLDRDPAKLRAIRRVVEDLAGAENGAELLPDGWAGVWEAVSAVAEASRA